LLLSFSSLLIIEYIIYNNIIIVNIYIRKIAQILKYDTFGLNKLTIIGELHIIFLEE